MHQVRRDGTGMECLFAHDNDYFVVHETFLGQTGNVVYTVWPQALRVMDWRTREHRTICDFHAWHITPNRDGSKVLCDTNHPDEGIFEIDVATGERKQICVSEATSGGSQWKTSRYALAADFAAERGGGRRDVELDGGGDGYGVRAPVDPPAPVLFAGRETGGLRERQDGHDAGVCGEGAGLITGCRGWLPFPDRRT
jgi:hypothetical protein